MKQVTLIAAFAYFASFCQAAPVVSVAHGAHRSLLFHTIYRQFSTNIPKDDPIANRHVQFAGFNAALQNSDVSIHWTAAEKAEASVYELERSEDGASWHTIAYFGAIGNSTQLNQYSFTDRQVSRTVLHYRVKEVDIDGHAAYTSVRSVRVIAPEASVKVSAGEGRVLIQFPAPVKEEVRILLVRPNGTVAETHTAHGSSGLVLMPTTLKGNYFVSVSSAQGLRGGRQIIL